MNRRATPVAILLAAAVLVFAGCPAPFSAETLATASDATAPTIAIDSPSDGSFYAKSVVVTGTVGDFTDDPKVSGSVRSLRYEIPSASIQEELEPTSDGAFQFSFSTTSFGGGSIALQVVAEDQNGNESSVGLTLLYGGSDIASFEATPANKQVRLDWNPVTEATGYTVRNIGQSEEVELPADQSSYTWEGLENGQTYFFQLVATDALDQINVSSEVSVIPLSPYTLLPRIDSFDDRVEISWREMPGVSRYVVEKASAPEGPYDKRFVTEGLTATDALLSRGQFYYYRVRPESQDAIPSSHAQGYLLPYSRSSTESGDHLGPFNSLDESVRYNDYLFVEDRKVDTGRQLTVFDISNPTSLVEVGELLGFEDIYDMAVDPAEQLLYLAIEEQGVEVVDIATPASPVKVPHSATSQKYLTGSVSDYSFQSVGIQRVSGVSYVIGLGFDGHLYSASVTRDGGEVTLTPEASNTGSFTGGGAMVIQSGIAYVAVEAAGLNGYYEVDVSNPASALSAGSGYTDASIDYVPNAIAVTSEYVFMGHRRALGGSRVHADFRGNSDTADYLFDAQVQDLAVHNGVLYVSALTDNVQGYDVSGIISSSDAPVLNPDPAGSAKAAVVENGYLVVTTTSSLESFELLSRPSSTSTRVELGTDLHGGTDFATLGNHAYFARSGSLMRLDLGSLSASTPVLSTSIGSGSGLIVQGDRALYDASSGELLALTPPAAEPPTELGSVSQNAGNFYSLGDITYAVQGTQLSVFDTSDTDSMVQLPSIAVDVSMSKMVGRGKYLYVLHDSGSTTDSGVVIFETSDPTRPAEVGRITSSQLNSIDPLWTSLAIHDIEIHGDLLFFPWSDDGGTPKGADGSDDSSGLFLYSLEDDPTNPVHIGTYEGEDLYSGDLETTWSWTKRFELVEVEGHLAVLSTGSTANSTGNSQVYEGRTVLLNVADPGNIYKVKDVLAEDSDPYSPGADFPRSIYFWKGEYVFSLGRQGLTYFQL